jgi:hypothetical protein
VVATAVAVLAAAGLGWVLWVTVLHSSPQVTSELVAYDVRGDHEAAATFTVVRRDAHVAASCRLRAVAADHSVVGELTVAVDSGPTTATVHSTVRTERRAAGVELLGCTADGQAQAR